jgi:hypothetical protein
MTVLDVLPLLVVVLLLVGASGADPGAMHVAFDGDRTVDALAGANATDPVVVAGGTVTLPADQTHAGPIYVVDGNATIAGTVDGDVTVLDGTLTAAGTATVTGELQSVGGTTDVAPAATVPRRTSVDVVARERSLPERVGVLAIQALGLALLAGALARRNPDALANVGDAITEHALVSGVVGALAGVTLLVGFVAMAFTVVLAPVSILGVVAQLLVLLYALAATGARVGAALPVDRDDVAAALGAIALVLALELLSFVPVVGGLAQLVVVSVGFGAVLVTYFGWQRFEPAALPE